MSYFCQNCNAPSDTRQCQCGSQCGELVTATNSPRYIEGLSSDLSVESPDFGVGRAALAMDLLSFCTKCGCVVYRRDLHDAWHKKNDNPEAKP